MMRPSTRQLISEVAARHGATVELILQRRKPRRLLAARIEIAMALVARGYSCQRIGNVMNRNHTTVCYYLGRIRKRQPRLHPPRPPKPPKPPKQQHGVDSTPRLVRYAGWDANEARLEKSMIRVC
jgi:DNA-binding CsgD family transcriptional regulator